MENKKILFDLKDLELNEKIKLYSSDSDILGNEKVDIYILQRKEEGITISYDKKNSLDCEDMNISFENIVKTVGTRRDSDNETLKLTLTENEKKLMDINDNNDNFEEEKIYKHYILEGEYIDGTIFSFNNIINVEKI